MVREAPHIHFQFPVDIGAIPYIMLLLGYHLLECLPSTFIQYQFLRGFQHTPAHTLAVIIIHPLLLEKADDVLIYPLLITLRLLVQIVHHTPFLLTVVIERLVNIHHLLRMIAEAGHQMKVLTIGNPLRAFQLIHLIERTFVNPTPHTGPYGSDVAI